MFKDLFSHKDLLWELVLKDLKLRYCRPMLGAVWAFLLPFLTALIFYVVFNRMLSVSVPEAPFLLYVMSAVFTWRFFQDSLMSAASSLVDNRNLVRESRFPHVLIPVSVVMANAVNLLPSLLILVIASAWLMRGLPFSILLLPAVLAAHFFFTCGLAVIVSLWYVRWRDVKYLLEAVLLLSFYLTPAFYSMSLVQGVFSPRVYELYRCNPFVVLLNLYRSVLFKGFEPMMRSCGGMVFGIAVLACAGAFLLWLAGYLYAKTKDTLNDHLAY